MATRSCSLALTNLCRHPRMLSACGGLLIGLWCFAAEGRGQETGLQNSLHGLLGATGLHLPPDPAPSATGNMPPLPTHEPAPLDLDAAVLDSLTAGGARTMRPTSAASEPVEVETIRERYPNRSVKIEREVTQDEQGNYVNHGSWKMWDERGNLVAEGRYEMGAKTGRWTRWHRRGDSPLFNTLPFSQGYEPYVAQATFENDLLHGDWTIYDSKQRPLSRISFANGERHGPATLWLPSGQVVRQANYLHGDLDGEISEMGKDGKLSKTAVYQQGRRLAEKVTYFKGSRARQTEATYLFAKLVPKTKDNFWDARFAEYEPLGNDERHGPWTTWYENGQVQIQGEYRHDQPVGQFTWWHPNGQKYAQGEYVDGRQHGVWHWWHRNGQKWTEGEYRNGEQTGQWSSWSETGRLDQQATYSGSRRLPVPESTASVDKEASPDSSRRVK